jgi:nitrile hydratase
MNGGQDLGGMMGFGAVSPEPNEPVFHADWERRVFAMAMAMGFTGAWSLDASRFAREDQPPPVYMLSSYYAIWLEALERQVRDHGLASAAELETGVASAPPRALARVLSAAEVSPRFDAGFPSDRPAHGPAAFAVGDTIVARTLNPIGHTRLPRYVRGRRGRIEHVHGVFVFPDTQAHGAGENPQWLYTVGFDARELWGDAADPGARVTIAAFESYLLPLGAS